MICVHFYLLMGVTHHVFLHYFDKLMFLIADMMTPLKKKKENMEQELRKITIKTVYSQFLWFYQKLFYFNPNQNY